MTNIAVVVLDTLRKDHFEEYFGWMPGVSFHNTWSTSHWTVPAHGSLFTGKYPSEIGVFAKATHFGCQESALAERLQDRGYRTRAFSANPQVSKAFNFDRGFDVFEGNWRTKHLNSERLFDWRDISESGNKISAGLRGFVRSMTTDTPLFESLSLGFDNVAARADSSMFYRGGGVNEATQRVHDWQFTDDEFLFINLMDTHAPYRPPEEYRSINYDTFELVGTLDQAIGGHPVNEDAYRAAYRDASRYLSDRYRDLFERLNDAFDVVFTLSDHGELLGEHGLWGHGYGVHPELTNVPFVISSSGHVTGDSSTALSMVDIHDMILEASTADGAIELSVDEYGSEKPKITEYHGITHVEERESLVESYGQVAVSEYEDWLRGIVYRDSYYYQTKDGKTAVGDVDRERMEELLCDVESRSPSRKGAIDGVAPEVSDHLSDLGYI